MFTLQTINGGVWSRAMRSADLDSLLSEAKRLRKETRIIDSVGVVVWPPLRGKNPMTNAKKIYAKMHELSTAKKALETAGNYKMADRINQQIKALAVQHTKALGVQKNPKKMMTRKRNSPWISMPTEDAAKVFAAQARRAGHNARIATLKGKPGVFFGNMTHAEAEAMRDKLRKKNPIGLPPVLNSKLASATVNSSNQKTGTMTVTNVSQGSCPTGENSSYRCPLLGNGCYAESGTQGMFVTGKLNKASGLDRKAGTSLAAPEQFAQAEAEALQKIYPAWKKTSWKPYGSDGPTLHQALRLHVVGDCVTGKAAEIVTESASKFSQPLPNGGNSAYGYTHGWRDYARSAWGNLSVLASCDTMSDIKSAMSRGWAPAAVIQRYEFSAAKKNFGGVIPLNNGTTMVPCPFEAERTLQHYQEKEGIPAEIRKHWDLTGMPPIDKPHVEVKTVKGQKKQIVTTQQDWIKARRYKDVQCVECKLCMRDKWLKQNNMFIAFAVHGSAGAKTMDKLIDIQPYLPAKKNPQTAAQAFDWSMRDDDKDYTDVIKRWWAYEKEIGRKPNPFFNRASKLIERVRGHKQLPAKTRKMIDRVTSHDQLPAKTRALLNRAKNPASSASALYEKFHGTKSKELIVVKEREHHHHDLAGLGDLVRVKIRTHPTEAKSMQREVWLKSPAPGSARPEDVVKLCSSEDGRQLYFVGGNQYVPVEKIGFGKEDLRDSMMLGELIEVEYRTCKGFDSFKLTDYYHGLGEETKVKPFLVYLPRDRRMKVTGGQYKIKSVGIVN